MADLKNINETSDEQVSEKQDTQKPRSKKGLIVLGIVALCGLFTLAGSIGTQMIVSNNNTETITIDEEKIATSISEDVMTAINAQLEGKLDESGNQIVLTPEELEKLQTMVSNEVLTTVDKTDLLSLSDAELNDVILNMQKDILKNLLSDTTLSQYFTEDDYKSIANYMSSSITSNVSELQNQITTNKEASETRDTSQDKEIASLNSRIASVASNATSNGDDITKNIVNIKSELKDLINENKSISDETKKSLTAMIESSNLKTQQDLTNLTSSLTETINNNYVQTQQDITNLNEKYDNYYVATKDINTNGSTTVTNENIHTYSNINIVYDTTEGYTVNYILTEGNLIITGQKNANSTVADTVLATIYIDNSAINAQ